MWPPWRAPSTSNCLPQRFTPNWTEWWNNSGSPFPRWPSCWRTLRRTSWPSRPSHWQKLWSNNPQKRLNPHNRRVRLHRRHDGGPRILHLRQVAANLAAAAIADHAFYHLYVTPSPTRNRPQRDRRARHMRLGVMSIIASNASYLAAYVVLLLLP